MEPIRRRTFLQQTGTVATAAAMINLAGSPARASGSNERVRLGVIGCGGRGSGVARDFAGESTCEVVAVCDPDEPDGKGGLRDPGTGRDVAEFLVGQQPVCGIVLHSSNQPAMVGMENVLREAGWMTESVTPYGDTSWIPETWLPAMRRVIVQGPCVASDAIRGGA